MSYFLAAETLEKGSIILLEGEEAQHLLARRIKTGEVIELQDKEGSRFSCRITQVNKRSITLLAEDLAPIPQELKKKIVLFQAYINEQALNIAIQKTTELGASEIIIFQSDYSPARFKEDKLERWQKISLEAAKQCGRVKAARVQVEKLQEILKHTPYEAAFYLFQNNLHLIESYKADLEKADTVYFFIGPEGGWSKKELDLFASSHIRPLALSPFTLRAETAAITILAQISGLAV